MREKERASKQRPNVDLPRLANGLRLCFRYDPPRGREAGKRRVERLVGSLCACSATRAAGIVDRLEARGHMYLRRQRWRFDAHPLDAL